MEKLVEAYNPDTLPGLMCRHMISVRYDGAIYDCDFNQMLDMTVKPISHLRKFDLDVFMTRRIQTGNHCFWMYSRCGIELWRRSCGRRTDTDCSGMKGFNKKIHRTKGTPDQDAPITHMCPAGKLRPPAVMRSDVSRLRFW